MNMNEYLWVSLRQKHRKRYDIQIQIQMVIRKTIESGKILHRHKYLNVCIKSIKSQKHKYMMLESLGMIMLIPKQDQFVISEVWIKILDFTHHQNLLQIGLLDPKFGM